MKCDCGKNMVRTKKGWWCKCGRQIPLDYVVRTWKSFTGE